MARTGPTNKHLRRLIQQLKSASANRNNRIWARVAKELEKPTRSRRVVNISRIARHAKEGDVVLVPGKVLSCGNLKKKITVAAWQFSAAAKDKIQTAGGKTLTISQLLERNPKGSGVKLIG